MDKNIKFQHFVLTQTERAQIKNQTPMCLWMTGLSGAGKTTLANALEQELNKKGKHTYILDGDNMRHGLNSDLSFNEADRNENVRRAAETAQLMVDAGLIVIVGLISPFKNKDIGHEVYLSQINSKKFIYQPPCKNANSGM